MTAPTASSTPAVAQYQSTDVHEQAVIAAVKKTSQSVVSVIISKDVPIIEQCPAANPFGDLPPEFQQFFGGSGTQYTQPCQKGTQKQEVGGGSGFIISSDGLILTNKHVVSDTQAEYTVFTNDGKKYTAKVLARDPVQDLAVLKIDAVGLTPLQLGDSDGIQLGQTAIAIGNALGEFRNTVSVGVVSGLSRSITASDGFTGSSESLSGLIQTGAAINPGNSGGPLLNLQGEVIGVNTAVASGAQNIGFSIPINDAKRDIASVEKTGTIQVPFLGVRYIQLDSTIAKQENLSVQNGALVRGDSTGPAVVSGSPADKAGLQAEDIITKVDGTAIDQDHTLGSLIQKHNVGDTITLTVLRKGKTITLTATLEAQKTS
ncbi:trypsin-like peptidase domain-containing protein [Patescibacteria group bacterium]|nr:trypsin-like peptidase domain-containing protein [Patescibacteria group bacterium]